MGSALGIILCLITFSSHALFSQINYTEAASGDLSSTPNDPVFTVGTGTNQWAGLIEATPESQADRWGVLVPCGYQVTQVTYSRTGADPVNFFFNACTNEAVGGGGNSFTHNYNPPLGLGQYCVEIFTDFNIAADPWTVTVTAQFVDVDTDGDGTFDCIDNCDNDPLKTEPGEYGCGIPENACGVDLCPNDPNKTEPGQCGCGVPDTDSDGDGVANCIDGCPNDENKIAAGICGCGVADTDSDGDGTPNCNDGCPNDPNKTSPGICGCGVADTDSDGDGTPNCNDGCPTDPNKIAPGICGCGVADTDSDGDDTPNCNDGCPTDPNKIAAGICGCGVADTDSDGDGTADCNDGCPTDAGKTAPGQCGCGNPDTDTDMDGTADCNDADDDNDGQTDADEIACGSNPLDAGSLSPDNDGDNSPDCVDPDDDNDGVLDGADNCPLDANAAQTDSDTDGAGDACDPVFNIDVIVDNTTTHIENLNISGGNKNALITKLENALAKYCDGKPNVALNILNAFLNQVASLQAEGVLTASEAAELTAAAQAMIIAINNGTIPFPCTMAPMARPNTSIDVVTGFSLMEFLPTPAGSEVNVMDVPNTGVDVAAGFLQMELFPNPASSEVNVRLNIFSNETARLTIFDHLGRALLVKYAVEGERSFQVELPGDEFPAGLYAVQVVAGKEVLTKQMVIAR